jgi:hypothetical protein
MEKVIAQYFGRKHSTKGRKGIPTTASTLSACEFPDYASNTFEGTVVSSFRHPESKLDLLTSQRRRLLRVFELMELVVQRETIKCDTIRPLLN